MTRGHSGYCSAALFSTSLCLQSGPSQHTRHRWAARKLARASNVQVVVVPLQQHQWDTYLSVTLAPTAIRLSCVLVPARFHAFLGRSLLTDYLGQRFKVHGARNHVSLPLRACARCVRDHWSQGLGVRIVPPRSGTRDTGSAHQAASLPSGTARHLPSMRGMCME